MIATGMPYPTHKDQQHGSISTDSEVNSHSQITTSAASMSRLAANARAFQSLQQRQASSHGDTTTIRHHPGCRQADGDICTCQVTQSLAKQETFVINCLRASVLMVLVVTATGLAIGVHRYTTETETENFTDHFEHAAHQVIDSFHEVVERNIGSVATMSSLITSYALQANLSFPFVTVPHFEVLGS
ncbi:Guanylate cyclase (Partial), partial [Seminavis robusta]|eukprot:Sro1189_g250650.1 Guanylate cyclase (186) ;mRNA; r:2-560